MSSKLHSIYGHKDHVSLKTIFTTKAEKACL